MSSDQRSDSTVGVNQQLARSSLGLRLALAWWVGAELVRRHPKEMRLVESSGHHGQALCVVRREDPGDARFVFIPLGDNFVILVADGGESLWIGGADALLAADRRTEVIVRLESALGLRSPARTPATTSASIGPLVVSAFLERSTLGRGKWWLANGAPDDEDSGRYVNESLFDAMPEVALDAARHRESGVHGSKERYWFALPILKYLPQSLGFGVNAEPEPPVLAIDAEAGVLWDGDRRVSLMDEYNSCGRSLDRLVSTVMPPAF